MLLSDSLTLSCTHTPLLCVVASQTKGLSGSTGRRGSPRSLLLLWLCRGEGTGLLVELDGISGSSGVVSLDWSRRGAVS